MRLLGMRHLASINSYERVQDGKNASHIRNLVLNTAVLEEVVKTFTTSPYSRGTETRKDLSSTIETRTVIRE
jgi:hypothetical protein